MGSEMGSGVVNNGFGNSGGWGNGPVAFGRRLYAISQQETATATATRANKAVIIKAMINPIMETQMSSTPLCAFAAVNQKLWVRTDGIVINLMVLPSRGSEDRSSRFSKVKMALD